MFPFGKFLLRRVGASPKFALQNKSWGDVIFHEYKTMKDIREELMKLLGTDLAYTTTPKSREHLMKYLPKSQEDLPVRKMKDSFDSGIVPLSSNLQLREKYTTFMGNLRLGRIMEDVDLFAVWCCTKHVRNLTAAESQPLPYVIVTIRVDHIEVLNSYTQTSTDVRLSGHVCWVGKSSMEVVVWVDQENNGKWERITRAFLLMAARNPTNTGPAIVNAIVAETPEEKELFAGGEQRKTKRMKMLKESLLKEVPSEEELHLVHNLFKKTIDSTDFFLDKRVLPPNSKWMQNSTLTNLVFCHPEYRNMHNKIFGGFLIRQALELSWMVSYTYGMRVPRLVHISDIGFYNPVDVGALLKLYASITYTEKNYLQTSVYAEARTTTSKEGKNTTAFNFTYDMGSDCDSLYPHTYLEAMKYIDGRRHFKTFLQFVEDRQQTEKKNQKK